MPVAALFGSSLANPADRCCVIAERLGHGLARLGFHVKTGGYSGVMEAASRGARSAGGVAIGVTVATLANVREPNRHLSHEMREADLIARLRSLIHGTDIFFAIECGGPGTLNEVFLVWSLMILGELPGRTLVLVGAGWAELIEILATHFSIGESQLSGIQLAPNVDLALDYAAALVR
jgi:uncharacterized protein (TIGR00725 family)